MADDVLVSESSKYYTYSRNGRKSGYKNVKRTSVNYVDEFGGKVNKEVIDVDYREFINPVTRIFKIILVIIISTLFLFGSYNIETGVYFGEYGEYDSFDTKNYILDTGETIQQVYNKWNSGITDEKGKVIPYELDYTGNDYDWTSKFTTLSRLRNPVAYDFIQVKLNTTKWNNRDVYPNIKDIREFSNITNYREVGIIENLLNIGEYVFKFDNSLNVWQIVKYDDGLEPAFAISLNLKIYNSSRVVWYEYIGPIMMLPINIITNFIYDVVVVVDFVKNW